MNDDLLTASSEAFGNVFVVASHLTRLTDAALADWDLTTRQWLLLAVLVAASRVARRRSRRPPPHTGPRGRT